MPLFRKRNAKHQKLSDELDLAANQDFDGDDFSSPVKPQCYKAKYLGHIPTDIGNDSKETTTKAVDSITSMSKLNKKQIKKVLVNVTLKGIEVVDRESEKTLFDISIFRICNFFADAKSRRTFAFLATNDQEITECHAFICSKRKEAESIALSVAETFKVVYSMWRDSQDCPSYPVRTQLLNTEMKGHQPFDVAPSNLSNKEWISFDRSLMDISAAGTRSLTFAEVNDFPPAYTEQPFGNQLQTWKD